MCWMDGWRERNNNHIIILLFFGGVVLFYMWLCWLVFGIWGMEYGIWDICSGWCSVVECKSGGKVWCGSV